MRKGHYAGTKAGSMIGCIRVRIRVVNGYILLEGLTRIACSA